MKNLINLWQSIPLFFNWSGLIWMMVFLFFLALLHNVLYNGRGGWGWPIVDAVRSLGKIMFLLLVSLFVEVTADHEGLGNWDDE